MILFFSLFKVTPIMLLKTYVKEADFLLSMLLSLRLLFRVVSRFSVFPSGPFFLRQYPCFVRRNPLLLFFTCCTAHSAQVGGGGHEWRGGAPSLVYVFKQACDLTRQPDYRFWIPFRIPFPQVTGESSSTDHTPFYSDYDATVYPPPYLRIGVRPFLLT